MSTKVETETDPSWPRWKHRMHEVIFEADTPAGKLFDVALLVLIILSVLTVVLESVASIELASTTEPASILSVTRTDAAVTALITAYPGLTVSRK